jgi:predicted nuclease with RNAse H fold
MARWLGVDVGGRRKGFDVAVVGGDQVITLGRRLSCEDVVAVAERHRPEVIGIDSPRACAPDGARSRDDERLLARSVCGIRWTPDAARVSGGGYYEWIVEGLELYRALAGYDGEVVEVFPTASWTRWHGPRGRRPRSSWTRQALAALGLAGVPERTSQDQRDAIAAAVTARQHSAGETERFGEIVVPMARS